jgi:tetratricopeptide (TPR) repeat protein
MRRFKISLLFLSTVLALSFNSCTAVSTVRKDSAFHLQRASRLLEQENLKDAVVELKEAVEESNDPDFTLSEIRILLFTTAEKYRAIENYSREAQHYLAYTENFDKQDFEAFMRIGQAYEQMGNRVGGLYFAKKAYALDPKNREVIELIKRLNPI